MLPPPPRSTLFPYTTLFRSLSNLPRLGLLRETCELLRTARAMEQSQPTKGRGITEFNHFFQSDRKSTRLNSSHVEISYAVFCLKKKKKKKEKNTKELI